MHALTLDRLPVVFDGACLSVLQAENKFKCPCHGSQYDSTGKKIRGPAPLVGFAQDGGGAQRKSYRLYDDPCYSHLPHPRWHMQRFPEFKLCKYTPDRTDSPASGNCRCAGLGPVRCMLVCMPVC